MAKSTIQLFGYILCLVGCFGIIVSTFMNEWKTYARANGDATLHGEHIGLWKKCTFGVAGHVTCTYFSSISLQTREINMGRGLMIASIILCSLASLLAICGLKCTKCLDTNKQGKSTVATIAGALFILGGLCAFGIISWYAYDVVHSQSDQKTSNNYDIGRALFVGWSAAVLCVTGGAILCICSRTNKKHMSYTDKRTISKELGQEYV